MQQRLFSLYGLLVVAWLAFGEYVRSPTTTLR